MTLPKPVYEHLLEALERVGLNKSEIEVFTFLLQQEGARRVSDIAKKSKFNRTTLYGVLKSLSKKGLITSVEEHGVLKYESIQPHLLVDYIERAREHLSEDLGRIKATLPIITRQRQKSGHRYPSVQFFEGKEGVKQAYEDSIKNNPSKTLYSFTGPGALMVGEVIELDWVEKYIAKRVASGVMSYAIMPNTKESDKLKNHDREHLRKTKLLPPGYSFDIELAVYEDKIIIASFSADHPLAILIEDERIAHTIKTLFQYMDTTLSG